MDSEKSEGRRIVVLSDGTGNAAAKLFKTNVWRLYEALDVSNASQIAFYDDGVGTSSIKPLALLGGMFGWGLKRNVLHLYTFLCRNYREGDRIYAFGFSRGAFTIRVLIRFILSQGLVANANSTDDRWRKALRLYRRFRIEQTRHWGLHLLARPLRDGSVFLCDGIFRGLNFRRIETTKIREIEFLGLWDTVDAYGLPVQELERAVDRWIWPLTIADSTLHPAIKKACHALSIDDARTSFHPMLWDESALASDEKDHTDEEVLTQVWFAGVHANVGGGYPDDSLSSVTLHWMINEARKKGLVFGRPALETLQTRVAPYGPIYNSRAGFGAYYRYGPRRLDPPVDRLGACIPTPKIHETVIWRMAAGGDSYAPLSLPNRLRIVVDERLSLDSEPPADLRPSGTERKNILTFDGFVDAVKSERNLFVGQAQDDQTIAPRRRAAREFATLQKPDDLTLDLIWDTVWWRRVANYVTLLVTGYVGFHLYELLSHPESSLAPAWLERQIRLLAAPFAALAGMLLPKVAAESSQVLLSSAPATSITLVALVAGCVWWGKRLDRRIRDRALAAWNAKWHVSRYGAFRDSLRFRAIVTAILFIGLLAVTFAAVKLWHALHLLTYDPHGFEAQPQYLKRAIRGTLENLAPNSNDRNSDVSQAVSFLAGILAAGLSVLSTAMAVWIIGLYRIARKGRRHRAEMRGFASWLAHRLRTSPWPCATQRFVQHVAIPSLFAICIVVGALVMGNRVGFAFIEAGGWICKGGRNPALLSTPATIRFDTSTLCQASDKWLQAGVTYQFDVEKVDPWSGVYGSAPPRTMYDALAEIPNRQPADSDKGNEEVLQTSPEKASDRMALAILSSLRRVHSEPWFRVIAQVGPGGDDPHFLRQGRSEFTPKRDGPLFFYVNHAVIGAPFLTSWFYAQNKGAVRVTISRKP